MKILTSWRGENRSRGLRRRALLRRWVLARSRQRHQSVIAVDKDAKVARDSSDIPEGAQRTRSLVHLIHPRVRWRATGVPVIIARRVHGQWHMNRMLTVLIPAQSTRQLQGKGERR